MPAVVAGAILQAILCYKICSILSDIGVPYVLTEMGYTSRDIPANVAGAIS